MACAAAPHDSPRQTLTLSDATYYAVVLTTNQVFYAKVAPAPDGFFKLTDVYYVVAQQADPQTGAPRGSLIRRGREPHGPDQTLVNREHVLFFEPVSPNSRIAELIKEVQDRERTK